MVGSLQAAAVPRVACRVVAGTAFHVAAIQQGHLHRRGVETAFRREGREACRWGPSEASGRLALVVRQPWGREVVAFPVGRSQTVAVGQSHLVHPVRPSKVVATWDSSLPVLLLRMSL